MAAEARSCYQADDKCGVSGVRQFDEATFLDQLYAAPMESSLWVPVMEQFADLLGGNGAWLSRLSVADGTGTGIIARIDPDKPNLYLAHFAGVNPFSNEPDPVGHVRNWSPRIRLFSDWLPREDVDRTEYYNDFLRPQDVYCSMMIGLAAEGVETCALSVNRSHRAGDFGSRDMAIAERFHPHWRRAFKLASRLALGKNVRNDMVAMLDGVGHGIVLVEADGQVRHANAHAGRLLGEGSGLRMKRGRMSAAIPTEARRLDRLIFEATRTDGAMRKGGSMVARNPTTGASLAVSVDPLPNQPASVFHSGRLAIICLMDPHARVGLSVDRLQQMFALTPAEARVALALLDGSSPREAADQLGVRYQTVRNQLQSLYQKTMTSRQAELVLLLARLSGPGPSSAGANGDS
jgi:DNA-binding CsgD family transcriptional regulator